VTVTNGGAGLNPTGTMTFFICNPGQVAAGGCVSGGTQVGAVKAVVAGSATSDATAPLQFNGKYCWRTLYTPDPSLAGVYEPATHTNATTECLTVSGGVDLPNTGVPDLPLVRAAVPLAGVLVVPLLLLALYWSRGRAVTALVIAGLVAGASPAPAREAPPAHPATAGQATAAPSASSPAPSSVRLDTVRARVGGWRLVIPRLGVDAVIEPVGVDSAGAMASPAGLDTVGWFNRAASPGDPGDAVIAGHYGAGEPGVFRKLRFLRPGDQIDVVWPSGRTVSFEVASSQTVSASAHPAGLFSRAGPARLSLITCSGAWLQGPATYSDRLIVTAMLA